MMSKNEHYITLVLMAIVMIIGLRLFVIIKINDLEQEQYRFEADIYSKYSTQADYVLKKN